MLILILIPVFWFLGVKGMTIEEMMNEFKSKMPKNYTGIGDLRVKGES